MQVDFVSTIAPMLADRSLSDSLLGKLGIERPNFKDDAGFVGPSTKSLKSSPIIRRIALVGFSLKQ